MSLRVYGPVPSRRLGNSLGVNNIPHKVCSYSCLYCQIGKAKKMQVERQKFYHPDKLIAEVGTLLDNINDHSMFPDYISIVPDGEPTLDINLGKLLDGLKKYGIPTAVISNASLIDRIDVQEDLLKADYVSLKMDASNNQIWEKINIPHKKIDHEKIVSGIKLFQENYKGTFVTETMLLKGINDSIGELENTSGLIGEFKPQISYISIPIRPTAFNSVSAPDESVVHEAWQIFSRHINNVELLIGYEGNGFSASGNSKKDLLSITAVHPMREDAVFELLRKNGDDINVLLELLKKDIEKVTYNKYDYYMRKFSK